MVYLGPDVSDLVAHRSNRGTNENGGNSKNRFALFIYVHVTVQV